MNKPIMITGIKSILPDEKTDVVQIDLNANGQDVTLHLHKGALAGLVVGLVNASKAFKTDPNATETLIQPLVLSSARPFVVDPQKFGLELTLERTLKLPVIFPSNGVEIWRRVVQHFEAVLKSPPKRSKDH